MADFTGNYSDLLGTHLMRQSANAPWLSQDPDSSNMLFIGPFNSGLADLAAFMISNMADINVGTAAGIGLANKANDNNVPISSGGQATCSVQATRSTPAPAQIKVNATTPLSTTGDANNPAQFFTLQADLIIALGATVSNTVTAIASAPGVAGNIAIGALTIPNAGVDPSLSFTNTTAGIGGINPDGDTTIRSNIYKNIQPKYASAALRYAVLGVAGVYDCYIYDAQDGSGNLAVYWGDATGANTNSGLQTQIATALALVQPPSTKFTYPAFNVVNVTALTAHYSAPATALQTTLDPLIKQAIADYIQGAPSAYTTQSWQGLLAEGNGAFPQVPTSSGVLYQIQKEGIPGPVFNFGLDTINGGAAPTVPTPPLSLAQATTLYRLTGNPQTIVTLTRQ